MGKFKYINHLDISTDRCQIDIKKRVINIPPCDTIILHNCEINKIPKCQNLIIKNCIIDQLDLSNIKNLEEYECEIKHITNNFIGNDILIHNQSLIHHVKSANFVKITIANKVDKCFTKISNILNLRKLCINLLYNCEVDMKKLQNIKLDELIYMGINHNFLI